MKVLLETLTPAFDWVIFDSPPSLPVHDASSLADLCDGVLFVIRAGETSYEVAKKAASEFRDKNLIGVVMNQVDKSRRPQRVLLQRRKEVIHSARPPTSDFTAFLLGF